MKKIKIYLQKPWRFSEDSQYYESLCGEPPKGIEYVSQNKTQLLQKGSRVAIFDLVKILIRKLVDKFYPSMPNAHYDKDAGKYDLIHCIRCIPKTKKPWVCDLEFAGSLWIKGYGTLKDKKKVLGYLKSPYCKKILPWTKWCAREIQRIFPEISDKVEVVYPAIRERKFKKLKTGKTILLYVSRRFYFKGGLYALETMDKITKKNKNVEGWVVSDVPKEIYDKYRANPQIKFIGTKSHAELFEEIYPKADIFLYPSFTDTFGYVILEAMSFGLPVISASGQSRKELIEDNVTGRIIESGLGPNPDPRDLEKLDEKIVNKLVNATFKLIKNKGLRDKMSKKCIAETTIGKFSIERRNKKLKKIISEALR